MKFTKRWLDDCIVSVLWTYRHIYTSCDNIRPRRLWSKKTLTTIFCYYPVRNNHMFFHLYTKGKIIIDSKTPLGICLRFRRFRVFFNWHTLAYLGIPWGSGYFGDEWEAWNFRSAVYTNSSSSSASLLLRTTQGFCDLSFDVLAKVGVKHGAKPRKKKMIDWLTTKKRPMISCLMEIRWFRRGPKL